MDNYYVEVMDNYWGVFYRHPEDPDRRHCKERYPNLVVWTYEKIYADKIAEALNVDDYIHNRYLEEL